jgi:hypothetical protein
MGQVKEPLGGYSPLWITFVKDAITGIEKSVLYKQPTQGRPCSMNLTDRLIKSTVPKELQEDEWSNTVRNAKLLHSSKWGNCKDIYTPARLQAVWIYKNNKQKEKGSANASMGKGAKKRTRSTSASGEVDGPSNKRSKPNNADAKSPADNIRERDAVGVGNWGIWGFGRKLGKMAQDAGLTLREKFRQYNAKGEDA